MAKLKFSEAEKQALHEERFTHPHPRVQQRMEVLWLISQGSTLAEAALLAGVSPATADRRDAQPTPSRDPQNRARAQGQGSTLET